MSIVADDSETRGDFWRAQPWVALPRRRPARPASYPALAGGCGMRGALDGTRFGVPRMYINADAEAGTGRRRHRRPDRAAHRDARLGDRAVGGGPRATSRPPARPSSRSTSPSCRTTRATAPAPRRSRPAGCVSPEYLRREIIDLSAWALGRLPRGERRSALSTLAEVDGARIFPRPDGRARPTATRASTTTSRSIPSWVAEHPGATPWTEIPSSRRACAASKRPGASTSRSGWTALGLDAVVFPAVADVGPADMDVNEASADLGWRNGVWVANGNLAIRHLGIPTVTVPMGHDGRHRDAGRPDLRRARVRRYRPCCGSRRRSRRPARGGRSRRAPRACSRDCAHLFREPIRRARADTFRPVDNGSAREERIGSRAGASGGSGQARVSRIAVSVSNVVSGLMIAKRSTGLARGASWARRRRPGLRAAGPTTPGSRRRPALAAEHHDRQLRVADEREPVARRRSRRRSAGRA